MMNNKRENWRRSAKRWGMAGLIVVLLAAPFVPTIQAADTTGVEDGAIKQNEMFEFEAFINTNNIVDGTAPFDSNDAPGNDSSPNNGIVRSFDTMSYPVKVTINPKNVDMLQNIKLRLSGTLDNGIVDNRVNAKFAVGGIEDLSKSTVSFTEEYTIEQTGNSIMIPVAINVVGATPGVVLTPTIKVEVVSVDGKPISGVATTFDSLPGVTVSSKVNIKPYINYGLAGNGIPYFPYAGITGNTNDMQNTHAFSVAWGTDSLPGKTDMRGATFPDPKGTINYQIDLYGSVAWDAKPIIWSTIPFNFAGPDTPFELLDHQPINGVGAKIGSANMLMDGKPYSYRYAINYGAPQSKMDNFNAATINAQSFNRVWDSGKWDVSQPTVSSSTVTYTGTNTGYTIGSTFPQYRSDGYTGSPIYGVNDKLFASHAFEVLMPNEYHIGGPNNPDGYANNANYTAKVTLLSYTDPDGNTTPFNKIGYAGFGERNNPNGSYSVQTTFFGYPSSQQLGTPNIGWSEVSKGDASTLIGQDVYYHAVVGSSVVTYGGWRVVYRWNTDAFELTPAYATAAKANILASGYYNPILTRIVNNPATEQILYGVANFPKKDNDFNTFTQKGIDDYSWYDTYDEAVKHGLVGAMQSNVTAATGPIWQSPVSIPLHVKGENIGVGSTTKDDTANIVVTNLYTYPDAARNTMIDVEKNATYKNPAIWDNTGTMRQRQMPYGSPINFETLAVTPAQMTSVLTSDKSTYYNSEMIHWTAKNSVVLPTSGVPSDLDSGVTITHTLPKGLSYKPGTGKVNGTATEPQIIPQSNGTTNLVWNTFVSNSTHTIPMITFDTAINPFALTSGVQSSVTITSVISSALDMRPANLRTSTATVTILKVGMVGIYESIDKTYGDKNSSYTVRLSPYTTVEDEMGVTGLTHVPSSGDALGSKYSGTAKISALNLTVNRVHNDQQIKIYLNKYFVTNDKPQNIDVTHGGWYEYTGDASQLDGVQSLLFIVQGDMTNTDNIQLQMTVQTANSQFGDVYSNETTINSATDYKLSPVSNRVNYTIQAALELKLERFQIFTNKASSGLPTSTRVSQIVTQPDVVKNMPITLAIYDKSSGDKVAEKTYKQSELMSEDAITIPSSVLTKDTKKNYEVRIEGYDTNKIWVRAGNDAINTDGYTAKEGTLKLSDADASGNINYKGVAMTERELGKAMVNYYESWQIKKVPVLKVKSGYGFELNPSLAYSNEMMNDVASKISTTFTPEAAIGANYNLVDKSLEYYDATANYSGNDKVVMDMSRNTTSPAGNALTSTYSFPQMYIEQGTGLTYTGNQKENGAMHGAAIDAGHKLYVPIWIKSTGTYDTEFKNKTPIGSNFMNFDVVYPVDVYAYMFNHTDSNTTDLDELLVHPMLQEDIPRDWHGE
jgi:hypothetical protein